MLPLFYSLYLAMFRGFWTNYSYADLFYSTQEQRNILVTCFNSLSKLVTSIFGDSTYATFGDDFYNNTLQLVAFVLALITSIGIVVMAVKGIKRVFSIFFMPIR